MTAAGPVDCVPESSVAGVHWPALPSPKAAQHLALLQQLERSQWWPADVLHAWQMRQLGALLAHAAETVPFYSARLRAAGIEGRKPLTPELWGRIPILTRAEVQNAGTDMHSTALPRGHGPTGKISSSGSTGRPLESLTSRVTRTFWSAFTLRDHLWHGRDFRGKLASIRAFATGAARYPKGSRRPDWGGAVAGIYPSGPAAGLSVVTPIEQQAEWLVRETPDYLLT